MMVPIKQPKNLESKLAVYIYNHKAKKLPSSMREYCQNIDNSGLNVFFYVKAHLCTYTLSPCAIVDSRKMYLFKSYIRHKIYDIRHKIKDIRALENNYRRKEGNSITSHSKLGVVFLQRCQLYKLNVLFKRKSTLYFSHAKQ